MTREEGAAIVEAILFTMGDSVEINSLAKAMEEEPKKVKDYIAYLKEKYEKSDSGIGIIELDKAVQLCTKKEMYEYLVKIAKAPKKAVLTDSLMETLSIIAYKQPITRTTGRSNSTSPYRVVAESVSSTRESVRSKPLLEPLPIVSLEFPKTSTVH